MRVTTKVFARCPAWCILAMRGVNMGLDRLQMLREERGWKQSDMARRLWVSQSTYSGYETGKIQVPVDTLLKLADIYDVSMDYLMGRTDKR